MMNLLPTNAILHALAGNAPQMPPAEALATFLAALQGRLSILKVYGDPAHALGNTLENTPFAPVLYQALLRHFGSYAGFKGVLRWALPDNWECPEEVSSIPPDSSRAAWFAAFVFTRCFDASGQRDVLQRNVPKPDVAP